MKRFTSQEGKGVGPQQHQQQQQQHEQQYQQRRQGIRVPFLFLKSIALVGFCLVLFVCTNYYMPKSLNKTMTAHEEAYNSRVAASSSSSSSSSSSTVPSSSFMENNSDGNANVNDDDDNANDDDTDTTNGDDDDAKDKEEHAVTITAVESTSTTSTSSSSSTSSPWDSSKSAVLGLGTNYPLDVYERFVGSLRATGYSGYILLGIAKDAPTNVRHYLSTHNVTTYIVEMANQCTYDGAEGHDGKNISNWKCLKDYPDWKVTWGRFGLYQDWLMDCTDCTDGILLTDVRDAYFQRDPFQVVTVEQQAPLMVFEEHEGVDTTHWLTDIPIKSCKGEQDEEWNAMGVEKPMLCSGSTMGSREGILDYINVMIQEFDSWKTKPQCRTDLIGDDQSIHNYLYYTNRIKNSIAIPHRTGPLHVVGYQAARIFEEAQEDAKAKNDGEDTEPDRMLYVKDGKWQEWLPKKHGLLDEKTGMIVNMDGSPSAYVHQYDRFGLLIENWFDVMKEKNWPYNTPV